MRRPYKMRILGLTFIVAVSMGTTAAGVPSLVIAQQADPPVPVEQRIQYLKETGQQIMEAVKTVIDQHLLEEIKKVADTEGRPPTMDSALGEELNAKYEWLATVMEQVNESVERASRAKTRAEAETWFKDAQIKRDTAHRLVEVIVGPEFLHQFDEEEGGGSRGSTSSRTEVDQQIQHLRDTGRELLGAVRKYVDEAERVSGQDRDLIHDLNVKYQGLEGLTRQVDASVERARAAKTGAEVEFWLQDALLKKQTLEKIVRAMVGDEVVTRLNQARGQSPKPALKPMTGFSSGILRQMGLHHETLEQRVVESDPRVIRTRSEQVYDSTGGRAGAGGISLHPPARVVTSLDLSRIQGTVYENGRINLLFPEKRVALPLLHPDYMVLALRSIYGREGVVRGSLVAEEPHAVVIQTGREHFGELLWKKEFLPSPWVNVPVGHPVEICLGPAIGLLSDPEPSTERVTYYGPIRNTRMGKVLLEADCLLFTFLTGVDLKTGLPVPPPNMDGYMTYFERSARRLLQPPAEEETRKTANRSGEKPWWHSGVWFVWVPDEFTLELNGDGTALEFATKRMKLAAWSVDENNVTADHINMATYVTSHYAELAEVFPILKDLEEVAAAVTVVRWLKQSHVPVELSWAMRFHTEEITTPEKIRRFVVLWVTDTSGKPMIEAGP